MRRTPSVTTVFGPAAQLAGIALPDAAAFAAMRATHGSAAAGAPAAPWLHLIALTLAGVVVLPRAVLALACAAVATWKTRRFVLPLDRPYFQRLLRERKGGAARVSVHPYGSAPTPQATLGLQALLAAALGPRVALEFAATVGFGREDDAAPVVDAGVHARRRAVRPRRDSRAREPGTIPARARRRRAGNAARGRRRHDRVRPPLRERRRARRRAPRRLARVGNGDRLHARVRRARRRSCRRGVRRRDGVRDLGGGCDAMSDRAPASVDTTGCSVALSLVSHTNVGKTALARTLLVRDIGEVRDAPHVTEFNEVHTLVETAAGERLCLWDTPGFGDTVRLVKRLRAGERPIVRFLSETWDRWRDRGFWASQQAVRNLRDDADLLLYLVDASQSPDAAGYVAPEMELLGWIGKPVIVLLNQLGAPAVDGSDDDAARWRRALAGVAIVRACCRSTPSRAAGCRS
jgi:hypothetical protein